MGMETPNFYTHTVIPGEKFGYLTVVREISLDEMTEKQKFYRLTKSERRVEFLCDCGNLHIASFANIRRGTSISCGSDFSPS